MYIYIYLYTYIHIHIYIYIHKFGETRGVLAVLLLQRISLPASEPPVNSRSNRKL